MEVTLNPYAPIRKVPLDYQGIQSSAFSVQTENYTKVGKNPDGEYNYGYKWEEKGVVSEGYLLIPNKQVKEMADKIIEASEIEWTDNKIFFNGKQFMLTYTTEEKRAEVRVGDDISLGFAMWNSYDGSRALSAEIFVNRLVCMNGMVSRKNFINYKFKHDDTSKHWKEELDNVVNMIDRVPLQDYADTMKYLLEPVRMLDLMYIRKKYIPKMSVTTFGKTIDKFIEGDEHSRHTVWDFLNAGTNILWHNKRPTVADFTSNAYLTDGMFRYANDIASA